jgi:hypothetical protein
MTKLTLPLIAVAVCLTATGCDFKLKRDGRVTIVSGASIPLNDRSGSRVERVPGPAEVRVKNGDADRTIEIRVRQPNRSEINFTAPVSGDYRSGNFTLRGSDIGQAVDLTSARSFTITGETRRETYVDDSGFERCIVETTYDPCREDWSVTFRSGAGAELGSFASQSFERCNERSSRHSCWRTNPNPYPGPGYPRDPRFPRGGGRHYFPEGGFYNGALNQGAQGVSFDGR